MDALEREPCSSCAEPVAIDARICRFCQASLLVDVVLDRPLPDARLRYQLVRALAALGPPFADFLVTQSALAQTPPRIARQVTRAAARRALPVVAAYRLEARIENPIEGGGLPSRRLPQPAMLLAVGAALLFVLAAGMMLRRVPPASPVPTPASTQTVVTTPAAPGPTLAAPTRPALAALDKRELARRSLLATVSIRCPQTIGSGVFVSDGVVLTNRHVLCGAGQSARIVFPDGHELTGQPERSDERLDLATLRVVGAEATPLPIGDAGELRVGDSILMAGSPMGLEFTVHEGLVSNFTPMFGVTYIQLDAKVNPGNSGGPLVDAQGRVVGIVSMKHARAEGIGFAVPINYAFAGGLLTAPEGALESQGFAALQALGQEQERKLADEVASTELRPGLVGAYVDPYKHLVARVARFSRGAPAFEEPTFRFWSGTRELCTLKSSIGEWKLSDSRPGASNVDPRAQAWLEKNGLNTQLYLGEAILRWDQCTTQGLTAGVVLELVGADQRATRLQLN